MLCDAFGRPRGRRPHQSGGRPESGHGRSRSRPSERISCGFAKPVPSASSTFPSAAGQDPAGGERGGYGGELCAQAGQKRAKFPAVSRRKGSGCCEVHPLPRPLVNEMQPLKRYTYVKFKHQVLLVNPMTRKIVDM